MKLIRYEFLKITVSRGFIGMAAALLMLSVVLGYFSAREPRYDPREIEAIVESYRQNPEETIQRYKALEEEYKAYLQLLLSEELQPSQPPASVVRFEQYKLAFQRIERQAQYTDALRDAICNLEKIEAGLKGEHAAVNGYLLQVYERNLSLRLGTESMEGLEGLYETISLLYLPLMLFAILLGVTAVYSQRERGTELLIHASQRGLAISSFAKALASALIWGLLCALSLLLVIGTYSMKSGFGNFGGYLQECASFMLFPIPLTVAESLLILFTLIFACGFAVCGIAALIGKYCKNRVFPLAGASLLLFTALLPYPPEAGSILRILSAANLFDGNKVFAHLYPVIVGETPLYGVIAVMAIYTTALLLIWGLFVILPCRAMETSKLSVSLPKVSHRHTVSTVSGYEWKKQLFANKTLLLLIGITVLKVAVSWNTYAYEPTYTDEKYKAYMTSIQGPYTEEKHSKPEEELKRLYELMAKRPEMENRYREGDISRKEMGQYLSAFYEAEHNEKALLAVKNRLDELQERHLAGQTSFVVYDVGWEQLLSPSLDVFLLFMMIAACCGLYSDEYRWGMHSLYTVGTLHATEKAKLGFGLGLAALVAFLFRFIDFLVLSCRYSLPLGNAPACGIGGISLLDSTPLWVVFIATMILQFLFASGIAVGVSFLSRLTKSKGIAFLLSLALFLPLSILIF